MANYKVTILDNNTGEVLDVEVRLPNEINVHWASSEEQCREVLTQLADGKIVNRSGLAVRFQL